MYCPECKETKNIKWFFRHQKENEEDESTSANVLTVLCTECGKNSSIFIQDYLEDLFPEWDDRQSLSQIQGNGVLVFDDELIEEE